MMVTLVVGATGTAEYAHLSRTPDSITITVIHECIIIIIVVNLLMIYQ